MIRLVPLAEIDGFWPGIAAGMVACCRKSGGDISPDWLFAMCRRGEAFLYAIDGGQGVISGALVGMPQAWDGVRVLRVVAFCGTRMEDWLVELLSSENLGHLGLTRVVFDGRPGFLPVLTRLLGRRRVRVVRQVYELELE